MSFQTAFAVPATLNDGANLDTTFAAQGKTQVYFAGSTSSMANGIAVDAQGRLLVAAKVGVPGNREYNPGWHTALDLKHLLIVSEASTRSAIERKESRGGHFRDDYPDKDPAFAKFNHVIQKADDGSMKLERAMIPPLPAELEEIILEMQT